MKCLVSFYMCKCILRLEGKEFDFACWSWQCQGKWWKTDRVENMVTECMYQQSMDNAWSYTTFEKSSLSLSLSHTHTHTHTTVSSAGLLCRLEKNTLRPSTTAYQKHTPERKFIVMFTSSVVIL